jgi:hypothetical protein
MKHLAAYLLLGLGGNASPSAKDIKNVLSAVGIEADDERLNTLLAELKGKDVSEVCALSLFFFFPPSYCNMSTNGFHSSLLPVPRRSLPFPLVVLVVPLLVALLPVVLLPLTLPLRRRRRRRRSLMRTWDSVSSTKRFLLREMRTVMTSHEFSEKVSSDCVTVLPCHRRRGIGCSWIRLAGCLVAAA